MTLDFSPQLVFAASSAAEGRHCSWGMGEPFRRRRDGDTEPTTCNDAVRLLPADPFGMGLGSTWTASFTGWIEVDDMHLGYSEDYVEVSENWQFALRLDGGSCREEEERCGFVESVSVPDGKSGGLDCKLDLDGECWALDVWASDRDRCREIWMSGSDQLLTTAMSVKETSDTDTEAGKGEECAEGSSSSQHGDLPSEAFNFVLGYLGVADLLSVARVCKTMRSAVTNDPLLWRCIHIGPPLNDRLTDDILWQLARRAQGGLRCLNLVECSKITDDGLRRVLESNRRITKLNVLGCGRLTIEGLLNSLKLFKTPGTPRMENLMIGGIYGAEQSHYEDLKRLLDLDNRQKPVRKPRFYRSGLSSPSCNYDCALDIELCPKCDNLRLIYDCPAETCQGNSSEPCRACTFCIARCDSCGRCIKDDEYEETFYLDILCSDCMRHLIESQEAHIYGPLPEKFTPSSHAFG